MQRYSSPLSPLQTSKLTRCRVIEKGDFCGKKKNVTFSLSTPDDTCIVKFFCGV
jgi:hypothetical protein